MTKYDVDFEEIALNASGNYVLLVLNESLNSGKSKSSTFRKLWQNGEFDLSARVLFFGFKN